MHGAPQNFAGDSEFTRDPMKRFLKSHKLSLAKRPVLRHNKAGKVERKHRTIKFILERLQYGTSTVPDFKILPRATFLSNIFCGNKAVFAFELVRGYSPMILGTCSKVGPSVPLKAYKNREYARALQRLLR